MQFRIEYVSSPHPTPYVLARKIGDGDFTLPAAPNLGGVPIARRISQPRALTPEGQPDLTIFAFELLSRSDLIGMSVGKIVELNV
jgi:hypothetical protein